MFLANTAAINNASHPARLPCVLSPKCLHYHTAAGEVAVNYCFPIVAEKLSSHYLSEALQ
jgi:hypothetical protein